MIKFTGKDKSVAYSVAGSASKDGSASRQTPNLSPKGAEYQEMMDLMAKENLEDRKQDAALEEAKLARDTLTAKTALYLQGEYASCWEVAKRRGYWVK